MSEAGSGGRLHSAATPSAGSGPSGADDDNGGGPQDPAVGASFVFNSLDACPQSGALVVRAPPACGPFSPGVFAPSPGRGARRCDHLRGIRAANRRMERRCSRPAGEAHCGGRGLEAEIGKCKAKREALRAREQAFRRALREIGDRQDALQLENAALVSGIASTTAMLGRKRQALAEEERNLQSLMARIEAATEGVAGMRGQGGEQGVQPPGVFGKHMAEEIRIAERAAVALAAERREQERKISELREECQQNASRQGALGASVRELSAKHRERAEANRDLRALLASIRSEVNQRAKQNEAIDWEFSRRQAVIWGANAVSDGLHGTQGGNDAECRDLRAAVASTIAVIQQSAAQEDAQ
ncbi:unnamed protein product [Ostreobium quekettii]|uniref:Uncharacterized protein n=1 Tax=Ostreobium quekettii TaxID=121088 RepID=A0A8S1J3M9_9CHLO|nr:unnamed protein product [Ostreobium quekettii]|eukprot:evm.model.scf_1101.5 EVM.evm.TU.scf_1101.5   scf_1101:25131-26204(-)